MSPLSAAFFMTLASFLFSQISGQQQKATGEIDFDYYNEEAKNASAKFLSYLDEYDSSVQEVVDELKKEYTIHGNLVDECAASLPSRDSTELNKAVKETLVKIQTIDNDLRSIAYYCTSLRVPESEGCAKSREQSLESLYDISTEQAYDRINQLMKTDVASAKSFMQDCINLNTSL